MELTVTGVCSRSAAKALRASSSLICDGRDSLHFENITGWLQGDWRASALLQEQLSEEHNAFKAT